MTGSAPARQAPDPFCLAVEWSPAATVLVDSDGRIVLANAAAERLFGYLPGELAGHPLSLLAPERIRRDGFSLRAWAGRFDRTAVCKDGSEIPVEVGWNAVSTELGDRTMVAFTSLAERRRSEERFRLVVEASPAAMFLADAAGRITLVNSKAEKLFGYARHRLLGRLLSRLLPGAAMDQPTQTLNGLRRDGSPVPVEVRTTPFLPSEDGGSLVYVLDLTEKQKAEERFRMLIESAPSGRVLVDPNGRMTLVNAQTERIFGYSRGELIGQPLEMLIPPRFRQHHRNLQASYVADPSVRPMGAMLEIFGLRKGGAEVPLEIGLSPIRIDDSSFILASILDLTERKKSEERRADSMALRKSERSLRLLAEALPNIVWIANPEGVTTYVNRRWYEATGLSLEDSRNVENRLRLFPEEDLERYSAAMEIARETGSDVELQMRRFDESSGVFRWQLVRVVPVYDEGVLTQWIGSSTDIHAQKESEAALAQAVAERTKQLEEALSEKTVLLQEVHHRVKNNLTVIASLLARKAETTADPEGKSSLEDSRRRVHAMALVHEHLYGAEKLDRVNFDVYLKQLSGEIHDSMQVQGRVRMRVEAEPVELGVHRAIPCGLIVTELLINAFKYGFPGARTGEVRVRLSTAGDGLLQLSVRDDGVGIRPGFDWRHASSLGLRIVQILTKQLDGDLELLTETGTEFRLTFPVFGI